MVKVFFIKFTLVYNKDANSEQEKDERMTFNWKIKPRTLSAELRVQ